MNYVPVSVGELIDKLSILHVKKIKISNEEKLALVNKEFELLYNLSSVYLDSTEIESLYHQLCDINEKLWDVEDKLRVLETEKRFEEEFIDLARKVYFTNDERFRLKNEINLITDSEIREVKEYVKYN
jgi:predicted RNA-binding protein with EMAP domain